MIGNIDEDGTVSVHAYVYVMTEGSMAGHGG